MTFACISLGSNLGDSRRNITDAIERIRLLPDTSVDQVSSLYLTAPWGVEQQPDFINAIVGIQTELDPDTLLEKLQQLEYQFGRIRETRWHERTLDLDIICYGNLAMETDHLALPHPLFSQRDFVLVPLAECYPDLVIADKSVRVWMNEYLGSQAERPLPEKIHGAL